MMCKKCGEAVKCPNCNISLTLHKKENNLKCHYCGFTKQVTKKCDSCGNDVMKYVGCGTEKLEGMINEMFPTAKTIRLDVDVLNKDTTHEDILSKFRDENIDILIGTSMVAKGHHFPNVTLVGIISADSGLNALDYRASEKTFQVLTQVSGRAGREGDESRVIIQTFNPDNFSIECSKNQNYLEFFNTEINLRKMLKYPPFCDVIAFNITNENEERVKLDAYNFYLILNKIALGKIKFFEPVESPINKIKNKFRWRIISKCAFRKNCCKNNKRMLK
jgi:primosomal protein N' (replication factor Y)